MKHIETLLGRNDFVILPGLGGFVLQYQSAKIDGDALHPSKALVGFNPLMNVSDGLLAIEVSNAERLPFNQAQKEVESEIEKIKERLKSEERVQLGKLGMLTGSKTGTVLFSPSEDVRFLPSNFGLNTIYYSKIGQNTIQEKEKKISIRVPSGRSIARYVAVGVIALGLLFYAPKLNDARVSNAGFNTIKLFENNTQIPTTEEIPEAATVNKNVTEKAASVTTTEKASPVKYMIIVASLATQKTADNLCSELKRSNHPNALVLPPIKTYRVAIESFEEKDTAVKYMENLRNTDSRFSDAWVLIMK